MLEGWWVRFFYVVFGMLAEFKLLLWICSELLGSDPVLYIAGFVCFLVFLAFDLKEMEEEKRKCFCMTLV